MAFRDFRVFLLLALSVPAFQAPAAEAPLNNVEVIKLVGLDLGDKVVIAKINEAPATNFDLSVDAIAKLKTSGASPDVIAAMLQRDTQSAPRLPPGLPPEIAKLSAQSAAMALEMNAEVTMHTKSGDARLSGHSGPQSAKGIYPFMAVYNNYPGTSSKMRTTDRRPSLSAKLGHDPRDVQEQSLSFLVKVEVDKRGNKRVLKVGNLVSSKAQVDPGEGWAIPYDAVEESPGSWRITPKKDLAPGEYGLYVHNQLYDFAVDP